MFGEFEDVRTKVNGNDRPGR